MSDHDNENSEDSEDDAQFDDGLRRIWRHRWPEGYLEK